MQVSCRRLPPRRRTGGAWSAGDQEAAHQQVEESLAGVSRAGLAVEDEREPAQSEEDVRDVEVGAEVPGALACLHEQPESLVKTRARVQAQVLVRRQDGVQHV